MQIKIFPIPIPGGEQMNEEMNQFMRSKRVLQTENQFVSNPSGTFWCFCIKYLDDAVPTDRGKFASSDREKVDYMKVLDEATFKRFSRMREIRKKLAADQGISSYLVFSDQELAGMAKFEELTPAAMLSIKGIGEKKTEKYGQHFFTKSKDEK